MLTAKLGNNIINCYNEGYSRDTLKNWAEKSILLCPICNKPYEYCHGKIQTPYFRHKEKQECLYKFYEPETEEHIKGKIILFEWIKNYIGVSNAVLEGWLPETKQRPDVMFVYNGKKYVIEYQCTPIASEYYERHELYQAAGIHDIWILGVKNYNLKINDTVIEHSKYFKTIESDSNFYLDVNSKNVYMRSNLFLYLLNLKRTQLDTYSMFKLMELELSDNSHKFLPSNKKLKEFDEKDKAPELKIVQLTHHLNNIYDQYSFSYELQGIDYHSLSNNLGRIYLFLYGKNDIPRLTFDVNENYITCMLKPGADWEAYGSNCICYESFINGDLWHLGSFSEQVKCDYNLSTVISKDEAILGYIEFCISKEKEDGRLG